MPRGWRSCSSAGRRLSAPRATQLPRDANPSRLPHGAHAMSSVIRACMLFLIAVPMSGCFQTRGVSLGAHTPAPDAAVDRVGLDASSTDTGDDDESEEDDSEV